MAALSPEIQIMDRERKKIQINIEEITNLLDGGPDSTAQRRQIIQMIENDPVADDFDFKIQDDELIKGFRRALRIHKMKYDLSRPSVLRAVLIASKGYHPLLIHELAFVPSLKILGSSEQVKKFGTLAENYRILGTYAQTELGHGTNLKKLETTATYLQESQEFVINSPRLTSMKFWPGNVAVPANHVILMANLIIRDKKYGMHPFLVQIRSLDDHRPMPGVTIGDIGRKFFLVEYGNGFLQFSNYRIPRENMLSRVAEVNEEGQYKVNEDPRLQMFGMLKLRSAIPNRDAALNLQKVCTIATRYSLVRHQGTINANKPEVPVLDYTTQQRKILPAIASAYAYHFASKYVQSLCCELEDNIRKHDYSSLPGLHALTACMKAYITDRCLYHGEICRRACGGHGYLEASGFCTPIFNMMASVTYEGENTVLYLQCARYLMKCMTIVLQGKQVKGHADYLCTDPRRPFLLLPTMNITKCDNLLKLFKHRARFMVMSVQRKIQQLVNSGMVYMEATNMASIELVKATQAHADVFVMNAFMETLSAANLSTPAAIMMKDLCILWGLNAVNTNIGDFLKNGLVTQDTVQTLMNAELNALSNVCPNALALVDAFDFTDKNLHSCLGSYDGNVYERLLESAKKSKRNKTEVHQGFYELFKDNLHNGRDELTKAPSKL